MLIESDLIVAHIKKEDWLKPIADRIFEKIKRGKIKVELSTEVFHELTYVLLEIADHDVATMNLTYLLSLENVKFLSPEPEIYVVAVTLMKQYNLTSVFDAIYAAQTLIQSEDKIIISTDHVYDKIDGIVRKDPRELLE